MASSRVPLRSRSSSDRYSDGTCVIFPTSATLIRIYPERFWSDVFALVGALTVAQALVVAPLAWLWLRAVRRREERRA